MYMKKTTYALKCANLVTFAHLPLLRFWVRPFRSVRKVPSRQAHIHERAVSPKASIRIRKSRKHKRFFVQLLEGNYSLFHVVLPDTYYVLHIAYCAAPNPMKRATIMTARLLRTAIKCSPCAQRESIY